MVNETVNVLREQVAQLTRERDEARRVAAVHVTDNIEMGEENTRLTAERDEWRALATKAQDERDQWMSKAGELTEDVAELRCLRALAVGELEDANKLLERCAIAVAGSNAELAREVSKYLSGASDTNPRI